MTRQKWLRIGCVVLMCTLAACASRVKNVTNLPAGVTLKQAQDWDAAVADLHKVASTVAALHKTVSDLHAASYDGKPVLSDEYYAEALRAFGHIDQLELGAEAVLRQTPQNFSLGAKQQVSAFVQQMAAELQQLNSAGAIGIKNPKAQEQVNNLLKEATAIVALILSL
jgi:hypothetical protein